MSYSETDILVEGAGAQCEDRAEIIDLGNSLVAVLADGAGGTSGGAMAAELLIEKVKNAISEGMDFNDPIQLTTMLVDIDMEIYKDKQAGETTAVIASLTPSLVTGISVGDSGAWIITDHGISDLTHKQKIKPLLGTGAALPFPFQTHFEGTLLIASDGLIKYAGAENISRIVRQHVPREAAPLLIDLVRLPSGELQDDVSIILARLK